MKKSILQLGEGENMRQWVLSEEEFEEFETRFEECEMIDFSDFGFTITID